MLNGKESSISQVLNINENVSAPIEQGMQIGTVSYYLDDKLLCSTKVIAETEVKKITLYNMYFKIVEKWIMLGR